MLDWRQTHARKVLAEEVVDFFGALDSSAMGGVGKFDVAGAWDAGGDRFTGAGSRDWIVAGGDHEGWNAG